MKRNQTETNQTKKKLGIFGGTYEGRLLAQFCREEGICAAVSVATAYGSQLLEGEIRTGRMDAEEMAEWIKQREITAVVDATHPFAQEASLQIRSACTRAQVEYHRLKREETNASSVFWVSSLKEAASLLNRELLQHPERKALLTTGSKELSCFTAEKTLLPRLFIRVLPSVEAIRSCQDAGFTGKQIIAMQGPFSCEMNQALLRAVQASYLVTKESGQAGGFIEKVEAARICGCQVIAVRRPWEEGESESLEEIKQWLESWKNKEKPNRIPYLPQKNREIILLGIGMGGIGQITWEGIQALGKADAFLGASRMVESAKALCRQLVDCFLLPEQQDWITSKKERITDKQQDWITNRKERITDKQQNWITNRKERITYKKEEMLSWLNLHPEIVRPVILFSGDTGFYSGAKGVLDLLKAEYPSCTVRLIPGISSLSYFAANIGRPWEKVENLSFHGREEDMDWSLSDGKERFFLLDGTERLHQICRCLMEHGQADANVWIGENMSYPNERIVCKKPEAVLAMNFEPLLACWIIPQIML